MVNSELQPGGEPQKGKPQIPSHWIFFEKGSLIAGDPDLEVAALDKDFLAIKGRGSDANFEKEYLFTREGKQMSRRTIIAPEWIRIVNIGEGNSTSFTADDIESQESVIILDFHETEDKTGWAFHGKGGARFRGGKLQMMELGPYFSNDNEGADVWSPACTLTFSKEHGPTFEAYNASKNYFGAVIYRMPNEAEFINVKGEPMFNVVWEPKFNEELRVNTCIVTQTHIPTGIKKILEAPLMIDLGKVKEAALAEMPYEAKAMGNRRRGLNIPWRCMSEVMGVALAYSYPDPSAAKGGNVNG